MLKDLNFVAFDFETTGLDVEKDEAIQVGIVLFDYKFNIKRQFSTYIRPKIFTQLSEIVEFTTGIKTQDINLAPSFDDIKKELVDFFDENTIIVGHNIQFDIAFMEKYLGKINYITLFDTYVYSKLFLYFEPSYALEVLADKYQFKRSSHDALEDTLMTIDLFKLILTKINSLLKKYPFLQDVLLKSNSVFAQILNLENTNKQIFAMPKKSIHIKKTKKIKSSKNFITDYPNKTVFNVNNIDIDDAISFSINGQNKVILTFSSKNRLNVGKSILKLKGIPFLGLSNSYISDKENEKKFLSKQSFDDHEAHYILKVFLYYQEDISIFDITNFDEYKVHSFLSGEKRKISSNFIITTHSELFKYIKERGNETIKDYTILFFDFHTWMDSLSSVINNSFDFYELLNKLEIIKYKQHFYNKEQQINLLIDEISVFFGTLFSRLISFFKGTDNKVEISDFFSNTQNSINQLKSSYEQLTKKIQIFGEKKIIDYWNIFSDCVENYCILEQKVFEKGNLKYIFNPLLKHIDINTFNDFMESLTYYNFTTLEKENYIKIDEIGLKNKEKIKIINYKEDINFNQLVEYIKQKMEENKSIFLVSNNKNFSNSLFKLIFNLFKEYDINANIYAENITGGQGKLLYYLKKDNERKVVIGGPEFLISNKVYFINYHEILLLYINGKNKDTLIKDIKFYI